MKIKRQKTAKKTLSFYKFNYNFRLPYQILIDGTFCQAALKNKIQIKEQMPKYLMGEVHLCTTNCVMKELQSLGSDLFGAKLILQRFQIRNCEHVTNPVPASECLLSMLEKTNPHHYFVATQDHGLTAGLKLIPGVPLLYIIMNTIVLDKPSNNSLRQVQAVQMGELVTPAQKQSISTLKEEQGISKSKEHRGRKRKRTQSTPNPLSCLPKKKKKLPTQPLKKTEGKKKRNRVKKGKGGSVNPTANP